MRYDEAEIAFKVIDKTISDEKMIDKIDDMVFGHMLAEMDGRRRIQGFKKRGKMHEKRSTSEQAKGWEYYLHEFFRNERKKMMTLREELTFEVEKLSLQES